MMMLKNLIYLFLFGFLHIFSLGSVKAQINFKDYTNVRQYSVLIDVIIDSSSALSVTLRWVPDTADYRYEIARKIKGETKWQQIAKLAPGIDSIVDKNIQRGINYEYQVHRIFKIIVNGKDSTHFDGYGYVNVGFDLSPEEYRGNLLLLVDETQAKALDFEIQRFISDLRGDGWLATLRYAPRAEKFNSRAVTQTKEIINKVQKELKKRNDTLRTVIFFGRIAVPYSGKMAADGHQPDHYGAWPADAYYTIFSDKWTDTLVDIRTADREENKNIPHDGKFDQTMMPADVNLESGRIDFFNLPVMDSSETGLLRNYLNKNYNFRHNIITAKSEAIIDDNFGMYSSEAFSAMAWSDFTAMFGKENVNIAKYLEIPPEKRVLWAYGSGSGYYTQASWVCNSESFNIQPVQSVFNILFGSYFGDWDSEDNLLRCAIGSNPSVLCCIWSGRPFWHLHHIGLGETIGYSTRLSQNNSWQEYPSSGKYAYRMVHIDLMGDPALKMYYPLEPTNFKSELKFENNQKYIELNWEEPSENNEGYYIYKTSSYDKKFIRINEEITKAKSYKDYDVSYGNNIYMLRSVRRESVPTGSFFNLSQGVFASVFINPLLQYKGEKKLMAYPNPATNFVSFAYSVDKESEVELSVFDVRGNFLITVFKTNLNEGIYNFDWDMTDSNGNRVSSGNYYAVFRIADKYYNEKFSIAK